MDESSHELLHSLRIVGNIGAQRAVVETTEIGQYGIDHEG